MHHVLSRNIILYVRQVFPVQPAPSGSSTPSAFRGTVQCVLRRYTVHRVLFEVLYEQNVLLRRIGQNLFPRDTVHMDFRYVICIMYFPE